MPTALRVQTRRRVHNAVVPRSPSIAIHDRAPAAQQIPDQNERVVGAGREHAPSAGTPFHGVERRGVASQFEEGGARLADVEDADGVGVGGEGGEEVGVVRGGGEAEERWRLVADLRGCPCRRQGGGGSGTFRRVNRD